MDKILIGMPLMISDNEEVSKRRRRLYRSWKQMCSAPNDYHLLIIGMNLTDQDREIFDFDRCTILEIDPSPVQICRAIIEIIAESEGYQRILYCDDDFVVSVKKGFYNDLDFISQFDRANLYNSSRMLFNIDSLNGYIEISKTNDRRVKQVNSSTDLYSLGVLDRHYMRDGILCRVGDYYRALNDVKEKLKDDYEYYVVTGEDQVLLHFLALNYGYKCLEVNGICHKIFMKSSIPSFQTKGINYSLVRGVSDTPSLRLQSATSDDFMYIMNRITDLYTNRDKYLNVWKKKMRTSNRHYEYEDIQMYDTPILFRKDVKEMQIYEISPDNPWIDKSVCGISRDDLIQFHENLTRDYFSVGDSSYFFYQGDALWRYAIEKYHNLEIEGWSLDWRQRTKSTWEAKIVKI